MIKQISSIAMLEPKNENLHIYSKFELPRLGCVLLATIMKNLGFEARAYFLSERNILEKNITADIIGISSISSTAFIAYRLGDYFRSKGKIVVMGGPHISAMPEEAMEHSDYCICGEGEISLPQLINTLNTQGDFKTIQGLVWRNLDGEIVKNSHVVHIQNLDNNPFPDFKLLELEKDHMGAVGQKPTIPIQTSRGCPFACNFCSVTAMFGRKFRFRSTADIIAELQQYNPKEHAIFFYDDNFTANRKRTKKLLREMIRLGLIFKFSTQVRVDIYKDPELLDLMAKAGCDTLYIGFESVDPDSLKEMNKNQSVEDIKTAIQEIRKRKIFVHGMFVFGFDKDNPKKARASVKFAIRHKIDTTQFLILTPLPGTDFYYKMKREGRLIDTNWDEYDAHHVKFKPKNYNPWQLQMAQYHAHAKFYAWKWIILRLFHGRFRAFIIGLYAHFLNRKWIREEYHHLRKLREIPSQI
ncbi:radical SAM protein [Promethearchaeum syntrophicum]|uniref:Radical SAM protein n=1 Tax=Promethearchaeum syntrophicum TaxID=2594042 RepID=A0A5B9DGE6_9ARCH|nr:radical SAM protein [Candidatus Prometheoarchaeum syntrophicum]QEE18125.1 Ribosomal protein S12 methylthiotransferase RimO [Candidatus Prometheoarchaeum syntrophicum]